MRDIWVLLSGCEPIPSLSPPLVKSGGAVARIARFDEDPPMHRAGPALFRYRTEPRGRQ
jgi:hypothetical protein